MRHKPDRRMLLAGLGVAGALAMTRTARAATCGDTGSLGPNGPTLRDLSNQISKPLAQAETRVAIASLPSTATGQFAIHAPGVYYFTGPMTGVPGLNFLEIYSGQVEVHFDEYHLEGVAGAGQGIVTPSPQSNIVIVGASFRNWPNTCINLRNSPNCLCEDGQFQDCDGAGPTGTGPGILALGTNGFIWNCDQYNCAGSLMSTGDDGAIEEGLSVGGSGGGFACGEGGTIENSFAMQNAGVGFRLRAHSTLTLSRGKETDAVVAERNCVIFDCEFHECTAGVTIMGQGCEVEELYISGCPIGVDVRALGGGTLVDSNHIVGCTTGIAIDPAAARCLVIRNQVAGPPGSVGYALGSAAHGTVRDVTAGGDINASPLGPVQAYDNLLY